MDNSELAARMKDFYENPAKTQLLRRKWKIDYKIPIFKGADRDYIDKLIFIEPTA